MKLVRLNRKGRGGRVVHIGRACVVNPSHCEICNASR